jgi:hypothetical protein
LKPGTRVLLDAHNAYPENGRWADRLERALSTGTPIAIEQDLVWYRGQSVVSHGPPYTGEEPSVEDYFFQRIRPLLEQAVRDQRRESWPIVMLNLDFKTNEPEHHRAVWDLLRRYEAFLVTARRTSSASDVAPLQAAPLLVLTGSDDSQERAFHDVVPVGGALLLFGATHAGGDGMPGVRTNYRRWANYPWAAVEPEGQPKAADWTADDQRRLSRLVDAAHERDLWIRFYTLDGFDAANASDGWTAGYNFGSLAAARTRWEAAIRSGVDFVAVDQYEAFAAALDPSNRTGAVGAGFSRPRPLGPAEVGPDTTLVIEGTLTRADYEKLLEREFDVPPGVERVDVELTYDDEERTVIDLGLRGPAAFRGWSGGGAQRVFVSTHSASYGYSPGPLEPGRWAVVLGVPNIRDGVTADYRIAIRFSDAAPARPVLSTGARWYVGDLHSHSGHSDGRTASRDGGRLKVPPHHVFDAARREGLDFIALTDHNTPSHWIDVDRLQPMYPDVLLLHGREVTTYRGHLNAFGERRFVDFRLGLARPMAALAAELEAAGAWLSINHPVLPDDERCMGCGWNDQDTATMSRVHGVEIVNGDGDGDPLAGWRFWAAMLNRGHRLVAIGGSDDHTPDDTADRRLGRPATVIQAEELSERALLDGLRRARAYVRVRGVEGPVLEFTATVEKGAVTLAVATQGAAGQRVEWIRNGQALGVTEIFGSGGASTSALGQPGDWFSVILRDDMGPTAFSNAIYINAGP